MSRIFLSILSVGAAGLMFSSAAGQSGDRAKTEKSIPFFCPVEGLPEAKACGCPGGYCSRKPRPQWTVDYRGGKIQLCCSECVTIFKKTPAKFAAVANHQLAATSQARQVKCVMCGTHIGYVPDIEVMGVRLAFCSHECHQNMLKLSPTERFQRAFGDEGFARGFVMVSETK